MNYIDHAMKTNPHLCIYKPSWSWRPRLYIHADGRYVGLFRNRNKLYPGIKGCMK